MSPGQERLLVAGGGRVVESLVLLPDGASRADRPLLLAIHNFSGDSAGFAELIHAERLRRSGIVVVLPQAAGWIAQWQGSGITLLDPFLWFGPRIDDVGGLAQTLAVAQALYGVDPNNTNVVGFSQGATLALQLTRWLDTQRPGAVRRLFLVAGSAALPLDAGLAVEGTDVVAYQPGRNGPQEVANVLAGEPNQASVVRTMADAKGCAVAARNEVAGVQTTRYRCRDARTVTLMFEPAGEHAWPRQDRKFDNWLTGSGSGAQVDFTDVILNSLSRAAGEG